MARKKKAEAGEETPQPEVIAGEEGRPAEDGRAYDDLGNVRPADGRW